MKWLWWLLVIYEGGVGIAELINDQSSTSNATLTSVASLPTVGTLVASSSAGQTTGGIVDLLVAGAIWYFALR
jgi:tellurite resistance protein TehA-like permease